MDRLRYVCRHIERYLVFYALREVVAYLLHCLLHILCHFHRVCTGEHVYAEHGSIAAVYSTFGIVRLRFERNAGYVSQAYERAVGIGPQYDFLKLTNRRQTSLCRDGYREVESLYGLLAQYAGRRLAVLVFQGVLHVLHRKAEACQSRGVKPYLHGIVAAAHVRHSPHSRYAPQQVDHVECGKVAEIYFVKLFIV